MRPRTAIVLAVLAALILLTSTIQLLVALN